MNAYTLYAISHWLYKRKVPFIPRIIYFIIFLLFNSSIPSSAIIGKGSKFAYGGMGVVIHDRTEIGLNCIIGQQVTIGGRSKQSGVPRIGNSVYIGAGSRILGDIFIGDNCVIGANAVVIKSIPSNSIAVGVPAKVVKSNIRSKDFY